MSDDDSKKQLDQNLPYDKLTSNRDQPGQLYFERKKGWGLDFGGDPSKKFNQSQRDRSGPLTMGSQRRQSFRLGPSVRRKGDANASVDGDADAGEDNADDKDNSQEFKPAPIASTTPRVIKKIN